MDAETKQALNDALSALACTSFLLRKYAETKDHHWLPHIDSRIQNVKRLLEKGENS